MEALHGRINRSSLIQPKVEAEIAFVLARDLDMQKVITAADVIAATDYVLPAFEIVDSRIRDWEIGLFDTVADNASSGMYVLGTVRKRIGEIDLKVENAKITIEGDDINYDIVKILIEDMGGSIHSIDEVVAGKMIIDDAATLQD